MAVSRLQVSPEYGQAEECILKGDGEMGGAFIVRLPAGDSKVYLRCDWTQCFCAACALHICKCGDVME